MDRNADMLYEALSLVRLKREEQCSTVITEVVGEFSRVTLEYGVILLFRLFKFSGKSRSFDIINMGFLLFFRRRSFKRLKQIYRYILYTNGENLSQL